MTPAQRLADIVDHLAELDAITVDDPSGIFAELLADYRRTQREAQLQRACDRVIATATQSSRRER